MIPAIQTTKCEILGIYLDMNQKQLDNNKAQINLAEIIFTNKNENTIINSQSLPEDLITELKKPINIQLKIDNDTIEIENVYLTGNIEKYNDHIYIIQIPKNNKSSEPPISKTSKIAIEQLISSSINQINIKEWNLGFSVNGFVLFNKSIESQEIQNIETYEKIDNFLMIVNENKSIKYYDITKAFPEISSQFELNLINSGIALLILSGTYMIIVNDNDIESYKDSFDVNNNDSQNIEIYPTDQTEDEITQDKQGMTLIETF